MYKRQSKYQGKLKPGETLDTLYERFNLHRPEDFTGHSLSVSDVIVLESVGDKKAFYVDSFGFCEVEDFFAEKLERAEITFTVAECGEFHSLGRYWDDISNAEEAIALWKEYQKGPLNGIPSIGIQIHKPGQTGMEDAQMDLVSGDRSTDHSVDYDRNYESGQDQYRCDGSIIYPDTDSV